MLAQERFELPSGPIIIGQIEKKKGDLRETSPAHEGFESHPPALFDEPSQASTIAATRLQVSTRFSASNVEKNSAALLFTLIRLQHALGEKWFCQG